MKVQVTQQPDGSWLADRPELPGCPVIGLGISACEAIGDLVSRDRDEFGVTIIDVLFHQSKNVNKTKYNQQ